MADDADLGQEAESLLEFCRDRGWHVATAESCTGGLIVASLTSIAGCSHVVDRGFVTYSNEAKTEMLGVPAEMIESHGAVSEEVARAMATGALARSKASVALSCTGIAGPDGGSEQKPVGLVYIGCATVKSGCVVERHMFSGDRDKIRADTVLASFRLLREVKD